MYIREPFKALLQTVVASIFLDLTRRLHHLLTYSVNCKPLRIRRKISPLMVAHTHTQLTPIKRHRGRSTSSKTPIGQCKAS